MAQRFSVILGRLLITHYQKGGKKVYTLGFEQPDIIYLENLGNNLGKFGEKVPEEVKQKAMETKQVIVDHTIQLTSGRMAHCLRSNLD
ncbi:hypothetical protein BJP34_06590 [Moorena producens PAL-8-15-08-1]|uniref:Uncharacterized protein n=1 Tax=Moorena producens PAL-8-15-08-1 TaxID=1458985 RepID=A0A1D8TND7_9CYAN|nr:hypothetical protein [Moorena producens]AOW99160.1 hypothetical protein BJP34_06590 [Moorena producens PAL-8-15-08-1]